MRQPEQGTRPPRWVTAVSMIALILALTFGILNVFGIGGSHGPGSHIPRENSSTDARSPSDISLAPDLPIDGRGGQQ